MADKRGDNVTAKKGRPTDNPKEERITVRLDAQCIQILREYCNETGSKKAEAIREGIKGLKRK